MPTYEQEVTFKRKFTIVAKNADEANSILQDKIQQVEFESDVESDGSYDFQDEDVPCPACNGIGEVGPEDESKECERCQGSGQVAFGSVDASSKS